MSKPGNNQHFNSDGDLVDELSIREFLVGKWVVRRMKEYVRKIKLQRMKMQEELAEKIRIEEEIARNRVMPFGKKKKKKGKAAKKAGDSI
jgi:kynurenine formamidase